MANAEEIVKRTESSGQKSCGWYPPSLQSPHKAGAAPPLTLPPLNYLSLAFSLLYLPTTPPQKPGQAHGILSALLVACDCPVGSRALQSTLCPRSAEGNSWTDCSQGLLEGQCSHQRNRTQLASSQLVAGHLRGDVWSYRLLEALHTSRGLAPGVAPKAQAFSSHLL